MLHILDSALWREMVSANQSFERKGLKINIEFESEMGTHCLKTNTHRDEAGKENKQEVQFQ